MAEDLRNYAKANAVPAFGVGTISGECIAAIDADEQATFPPVGNTVTAALKKAHEEAEDNDQ